MLIGFTGAQDVAKEVKNDHALSASSVGRYSDDDRNQAAPYLVQNSTEGAFVLWHEDQGNNSQEEALAQRINPNNGIAWAHAGRAIANTDSSQMNLVGISDGAGGVISAFADKRDGEWRVYAMRNSPTGGPMWANDGILLGTNGLTGPEVPIRIVSDGAGDAIVVWEDEFNATDHDVVAQRIDASGNL